MTANYYQILGIKRTASSAEIKRQYRRLARSYHPDQQSEEMRQEAEERFKLINQAYDVLSDPQKRSQYDRFGRVSDFRSGGMGFTTFTGGHSKRSKIQHKLDLGKDFDLHEFANELRVSFDNLRKVLKMFISRGMVDGSLINGRFVFYRN